jgi:hypothetical protein
MRRIIAFLFWGIVGVAGVLVVGIVFWIALSSFTGLESPATARLAAARPIPPQSTQNEMISAIVAAYRENEARFKRDYVGRTLSTSRMPVSRVSENIFSETTRVDFGSVYCNLPRGSNRAIADWNRGDEIDVSGIIKDVWFGQVELDRCLFRDVTVRR